MKSGMPYYTGWYTYRGLAFAFKIGEYLCPSCRNSCILRLAGKGSIVQKSLGGVRRSYRACAGRNGRAAGAFLKATGRVGIGIRKNGGDCLLNDRSRIIRNNS